MGVELATESAGYSGMEDVNFIDLELVCHVREALRSVSLVQDLHSITPDYFLEVSGAVIHPLSYQQVLLSQCHWFRALVLLGRFLDMGPWAVDLALSVGIFPYILKFLQTTTPELRQILVFIWTKILALDKED